MSNFWIAVAAIATIVSAVAAVISVRMAQKARSVGKAAVSLHNVVVQISRPKPNEVKIRPVANLENVGKEPLKILEIKTGYYEFMHARFTVLTSDHALVNPIHVGARFHHPWSFSLQGINPALSEPEVLASMPQWMGKIGLVIIVEYEGEIAGNTVAKYYIGYKGGNTTHQLTAKEYSKMEPHLREDFRR